MLCYIICALLLRGITFICAFYSLFAAIYHHNHPQINCLHLTIRPCS